MTIGDYLEIGMVIVAVIVVPAAIIKAWWPVLRKAIGRLTRSIWAALCRTFVIADDGGDTYVPPPEAWRALVGLFWREDMSSASAQHAAGDRGASGVRHQAGAPVSLSAEPNTGDTERVSGVDLDADPRAIVRAALIAELLDSGLLTNRDKAICVAFHCSKASSSRPDAPFQKALRLVEQHRAKARPEYVGDMIARVEREVAAHKG